MNRALLIFPVILFSLLLAVWTGWLRIGWSIPVTPAAAFHGILMVNSFLASLIFLERAVTFKNRWVLLLPAVNAASVIAFLSGNAAAGNLMLIAGSCGFIGICIWFAYRHEELFYFIFLAGAFCLLTGNIIIHKTSFYPSAVNWWVGFLLFTIVAERLELSRFLPVTRSRKALLLVFLGMVLAGIILPFHLHGDRVLASGLALSALWLLRYDMARHAIRAGGQHRYSGLLLISGYAWMLATAFLMWFQSSLPNAYDAVLHAFFIGFVFSMIFSHAPIILPAVAGVPYRIYRPVLYLWAALLQASLLLRIAGDMLLVPELRKAGGISNGIIILLFFLSLMVIMFREVRKRRHSG